VARRDADPHTSTQDLDQFATLLRNRTVLKAHASSPRTLGPGQGIAFIGPIAHAGAANPAGVHRMMLFYTATFPGMPRYNPDHQFLPWTVATHHFNASHRALELVTQYADMEPWMNDKPGSALCTAYKAVCSVLPRIQGVTLGNAAQPPPAAAAAPAAPLPAHDETVPGQPLPPRKRSRCETEHAEVASASQQSAFYHPPPAVKLKALHDPKRAAGRRSRGYQLVAGQTHL